MSVDTGEFMLAGTEIDWPIGVGAGPTNHPDIEVVARRVAELSEIGVSFLPFGSWKLGEPHGGSAHTQLPDGSWMYKGATSIRTIQIGQDIMQKACLDLGLTEVSLE